MFYCGGKTAHVESRDRKQGTVLDDSGRVKCIYNRQVFIASSCYILGLVMECETAIKYIECRIER